MARQENQKLKLIKLIQILMRKTDENHGISMSEILDLLEKEGIHAERKSIYDDFMTLNDIGMTVEKLPSRPPKYWLSYRIFELPELKLLVDAVQSSKFITNDRSREIIKKLKNFSCEYEAQELQRQIIVDGKGKTTNKASLYSIDFIHTAINNGKMIKFQYFDYDSGKHKVLRHGGKFYTVSPLALLWSEENYYLAAYDENSKSVRNYRVDKMTATNVLEEKISIEATEERPKLKDYSQKIFGMYGGEETTVTLDCDVSLSQHVIDRFGMDTVFIKSKKGFQVAVRVMVSPTFFAWVLGFGSKMKIVSPEPVKEQFLSELKATIDNYENN